MNKKNILVCCGCDCGIGDFVWATSAISLIKQYDKNIKITLVMSKDFLNLIDKTNLADNYIFVSKKYFNHRLKYVRYIYKIFFILINYLTLKKYYTAIFLDNISFLSMIMKKVCNINIIYGTDLLCFGYDLKNEDIKYYTNIIKMPKDMDRLHCMIKYQLMIRKIFPIQNLSMPILNDTSFLSKEITKKFLQNTKKYKIALCMKGTTKWRYWPTEYFIDLIRKIDGNYETTFFIIGNDNTQLSMATDIKNSLKEIDIRNLVKKTTLLELKELINNMDMLISVDSLAIHFAGLKNIPTIALHGQSLPERTGAINPNAISMCSYEECSPCDKERCNDLTICKYPKCMYNITSEMVFEEVKKILKK